MPSQTGYYDTLKSAAGKIFSFLSSITLTGTDGKTVTVTQDTSLDEAVAMSSKAPKASPSFTGDVKGTSGNTVFGSVDPTNNGIVWVGGKDMDRVSLEDNQSITITLANCAVMSVDVVNYGAGGLFYITESSATIAVLSDTDAKFEITDIDTGKIAVFKGAGSKVVTIKNYMNAARILAINVLGSVASSTAPA